MTPGPVQLPTVRRSPVLPGIVAVIFGGLYAALSLVRFRQFELSSFDNAIFEQGIRGYAHLGAPIVDVKGPGFNQLGDHFSPIIALVAPFYRLFPSAETILIAQAVLLAMSVGIVGHTAIKHLGRGKGLAITVAYGLSFGIQAAVRADFHEVAFAAPLLALAGSAYLDRDWRRVVLWTLPLLLVKEDMGLTVAAIGAVLWFVGERRRGTALVVAAVVALVIVLFVIIPAFNPGGEWDYTNKLGADRSILAAFFDQPGRKIVTVLLTFAMTGMLAFLSPWALLALPILATRFAADEPFYWGIEWHYSLTLMPIMFIALIDAMNREHRQAWLRVYAAQGAAIAVAFAAVMQLSSPLSALVKPGTYDSGPRTASAKEVLALVPEGVSVETDIGLMSHLVTGRTVYWLGTIGDVRPDYILFDQAAGIGSPEDIIGYAQETHGGTWTLLYDTDGYALAKHN